MNKIDDKSGYDYILLSLNSQLYFGIEWQGWWLVYVSLRLEEFSVYLPDCWSGLHHFFFRSLGVTCSLYIDDRLNGECFFPPLLLFGPLLCFQASVNAVVTVVVPLLSPLPGRRPLLNALSSQCFSGQEGITGYAPLPFKGWFYTWLSSPYSLLTFRIGKKHVANSLTGETFPSFQSLPLVP